MVQSGRKTTPVLLLIKPKTVKLLPLFTDGRYSVQKAWKTDQISTGVVLTKFTKRSIGPAGTDLLKSLIIPQEIGNCASMKFWLKGCVSICFILVSFLSNGQNPERDFHAIDWRASRIDAPSVDSLARLLTAPYQLDIHKVRSIFRWVTDHIDYRTGILPSGKDKLAIFTDTVTAWRSADEMMAEMVFHRRLAVCEGYARLFKTLCNYSGIAAEVINGYVGGGRVRRFGSNHSWNSVKIDNSWYLLDVTWASGFVSFSNQFVRHFDEHYFLTPPCELIRTHYPEDLQWSLLEDPPLAREFHQTPFKHRSFIKYNISAYTPSKGIIEASLGDTIHIVMETKDPEKDNRIGPDPFFDSSYFNAPSRVFLTPDISVHPKKIHYSFVVTNSEVEWLHLMYNDDVVLRYKLNIRNDGRTATISDSSR